MKPEVLELKPPEPNDKLVALARDLLEGAESGRIQNLVAVWSDLDPEEGRTSLVEVCRAATASDLSVWAILGGLDIAKDKVLSGIRDASSGLESR